MADSNGARERELDPLLSSGALQRLRHFFTGDVDGVDRWKRSHRELPSGQIAPALADCSLYIGQSDGCQSAVEPGHHLPARYRTRDLVVPLPDDRRAELKGRRIRYLQAGRPCDRCRSGEYGLSAREYKYSTSPAIDPQYRLQQQHTSHNSEELPGRSWGPQILLQSTSVKRQRIINIIMNSRVTA